MKQQGCQLWSIVLAGKTGRVVGSCDSHTLHQPKIIYGARVLRGEMHKKNSSK